MMSTQGLAAAGNSLFIPAPGKKAPATVWGFAVRKRQPAGDAWWNTVTHFIPAPWHPARAVAFGAEKPAKKSSRPARRGRKRAA